MFSVIKSVGIATSGFWRDLTEKYCILQAAHSMLRADRDYIVGSGEPAKWTVVGAGSSSATLQFEILAKRGAVVLPHARGSDLLCVWLEAVSRESVNFKWDDREGIEVDAGNEGLHHLTGTIWRLCEASANYCREMEGKTLEAEALVEEARQRRSAPEEEIPESVKAGVEKGLPKKSFAT